MRLTNPASVSPEVGVYYDVDNNGSFSAGDFGVVPIDWPGPFDHVGTYTHIDPGTVNPDGFVLTISGTAVPEPVTGLLLGLGALCAVALRKKSTHALR